MRVRGEKVNGEQGYTGPFTKDVEFETCSDVAHGHCPKTVKFAQPPN
jgi:hypothetical protein